MNVSELIKQLEQLDQQLEVCHLDVTETEEYFQLREITNVSEITTSTGDRCVVIDFCHYLSESQEIEIN